MPFNPDPTTIYILVSTDSGKALDVTDASKVPETPLIQWTINRNANQQWRFVDQGSGAYSIVSVNSNLVVTAQSGAAVQSEDTGDPSQRWNIREVGPGQYQIASADTGFVLYAGFRNMEDGAPMMVGPVPRIFPPPGSWQFQGL